MRSRPLWRGPASAARAPAPGVAAEPATAASMVAEGEQRPYDALLLLTDLIYDKGPPTTRRCSSVVRTWISRVSWVLVFSSASCSRKS